MTVVFIVAATVGYRVRMLFWVYLTFFDEEVGCCVTEQNVSHFLHQKSFNVHVVYGV